MKVLITGAGGFVGKNLVAELHNQQYFDLYLFDQDTDPELLDEYAADCDFVFHLAGVNRPTDPDDFMRGNFGFTSTLLETLKKHHNTCPILLASSIQATLDNAYGQSKKAGEDLLFRYAQETGAKALIYRFPNIFGKWCRPQYNSVVATFCHHIARDLPVQVNDRSTVLRLVYIDDVVHELIRAMNTRENRVGDFCEVPVVHTVTLGEIVDTLYRFRQSRVDLSVPNMANAFEKKLYSTYLSYLPADGFSYPLKMNVDARGSFTEILRTADRGQFSVNVAKPGITKGNHWHHTKNEKFLVVSGQGIIRFRLIGSEDVIDYAVSGEKLEVIDIPTGYTHSIVNVGDTDLVTFMWANEAFDPENPDTYFEKV